MQERSSPQPEPIPPPPTKNVTEYLVARRINERLIMRRMGINSRATNEIVEALIQDGRFK